MKIILTLLTISFFIGCSLPTEPTETEEKDDPVEVVATPQPSTYPTLSGTYTYYSYITWNSGIYEIYHYDSYTFNDTTKCTHYVKLWSYTTSGWYNPTKESHLFTEEWKVVGSTMSTRLWDNDFSSWDAMSFEYISSNDSIKIDDKIYTKN